MSITLEQLSKYKNPIFIETGTYTGITVQKALDAGFEEIHSIEISPTWHEKARHTYADQEHVNLHLGNSADVLRELLPQITRSATLWLDAHNFEFCPEKIVHGNACPLLDELECLCLYPQFINTILIDDLPNFDFFNYDIEDVKTACLEINDGFVFSILQNRNRENQILVARMRK